MEVNDIKARLKQAYHHLKGAGLINDQKDLADKMGYSRTSISKALNGYEDYLTESFVMKLQQTFSNVFSKEWLLTGDGNMLKNISDTLHNANSHESLGNNEFILYLRDQISDLKDVIESKDREINNLNQEIGRLKGILDENKIQYRQTGT